MGRTIESTECGTVRERTTYGNQAGQDLLEDTHNIKERIKRLDDIIANYKAEIKRLRDSIANYKAEIKRSEDSKANHNAQIKRLED
jgi:chromosome segregation ATPase